MKGTKKQLLSIFILVICALIFYFPLLFQQKMYITQDWGRGDLTHFNYPLHNIYGNALKHFSFPFWTDEIYSGFQLGAEGQTGFFYLPNMLLFFIFPNYTAFSLSYFFTSLLATIGMYLYCRTSKLHHLSSIFAAITFGYNMFFACHFVHFNMVQAFSLIPWFFLLGEIGIKKNFTWYVYALLSFLQMQMLFIGHPQIALYTSTILLIYIYFRSAKPVRFYNVFVCFLGIVSGAILAMVQLLPTWELSKLSPSTQLESAASTMMQYPFRFQDFLYLLLPSPFGDPSNTSYKLLLRDAIYWENNIFSGTIAAIFAAMLISNKNKKPLKLYSILFFILLIFSTGWIYIFFYIPPFSLFRLPQRALILCLFFFSILSAIGMEQAMTYLKRFGKYAAVIPSILIALQFTQLAYLANSYNNPISKDKWLSNPPTASYVKKSGERIYSIGGVKLWEEVYQHYSHGWRGEKGELLSETKGILDPNRNATYGSIPSLEGYAKLVPLRTLAYLSLIRKGIDEEGEKITVSSTSARLLGASGVKYLVTAKPVEGPIFSQAKQFYDAKIDTTFHVYENPFFLPRVRSVATQLPLNRTRNITPEDLIASDNWKQEVFGEEQKPKNFSKDVTISPNKNTDQQYTFEVTAKGKNALIVVSQSFDQDWKATIDGNLTKIIPVNINSQGIIIPEGTHHVNLWYVPESFIKGGYISLAGIGIVLIISLLLYKYGRQ